MRTYPPENWKALGKWVSDARMQGPDAWRDMDAWAGAVGRSTRQLRGLERGERVGKGTLERVAETLGTATWWIFAKLADPNLEASSLSDSQVRELKDASPVQIDPVDVAMGLARFTDEELLGEVGRRMTSLRANGHDGIEALKDAVWVKTSEEDSLPIPNRSTTPG